MQRWCARIGVLALLVPGAPVTAQLPRAEIAFAPGAALSGLPAISWLCGTLLPQREEWPRNLEIGDSFVLNLSADGLSIGPNSVDLPPGTVVAGSVEFAANQRALCSCGANGAEDWYVPRDAAPPAGWVKLLKSLHAVDTGRAHTIDLAVAAGHLLGATVEGDADSDSILLGAALCGHVTWQAWWNSDHLRVRGRSDGGLLLPAVLLALAQTNGNGEVAPLPMRAFVARDGDREEAVRQMSHSTGTEDRSVLLAMLHGNDELRLAAIDSLVRLRSARDLPRIVDAAGPNLPLSTVAAADAVAALWDDASPATRERTLGALAASQISALRDLEPGHIQPAPEDAVAAEAGYWRLLTGLFLLATAVFGFWLRERTRAAAFC